MIRRLTAAAALRAREHGIVLPTPELMAGADRLGFVNIRPDADKTFRRYDLLRLWGSPGEPAKAHPSLALAGAMASRGATDVVVEQGASIGLPGGPMVTTDPDARMLLNFRGSEFTFAPVKFVNILVSVGKVANGEPPLYAPERWKDKIVLIGIHAEGYEDTHQTPLSERFPGVELHATAIDNLLHGDALFAPRRDLALAAAATALGTAAVFALPGVIGPLVALVVLFALGIAFVRRRGAICSSASARTGLTTIALIEGSLGIRLV